MIEPLVEVRLQSQLAFYALSGPGHTESPKAMLLSSFPLPLNGEKGSAPKGLQCYEKGWYK